MVLGQEIKKILQKNKFIRGFYNLIRDLTNISNLKPTLPEKREGDKIIVAFICQYIPAWNKFKRIYRQMLNDKRFNVKLVCLPMEIEGNQFVGTSLYNKTYEYFINHGYAAINALMENGTWLDLKQLKCDFVIYTRPYNSYLPLEYTSHNVCKYSRIVSLLYAMNLTYDLHTTLINRDFFDDVSIFFATTETSKEYFIEQYPLTVKMGLKICKNLGIPVMEQILLDKGKPSTSWNFSKNKFRIMWTPRWSTNKELGGSNFFVYYKLLLEYAEKNEDIDLLCRPHPLMFGNFLKTGEMTIEEIDNYKKRISSIENVCIDIEEEYNTTIWNSSVLISDISGIMPEYFVTGKPLIYCCSNMELTLEKHTEEMLKGCYIAENPEKMFKYIDMLKKGKDPLQEIRKQIISRLFGNDINNSSKRIVEYMVSFLKKNRNHN